MNVRQGLMAFFTVLRHGLMLLLRRPRMLPVGTPAPDFAVLAHDGSTVRLSALRGQTVVLWFYPKASTGG